MELKSKLHKYQSDNITVTYDLKRCIHAAECIRGLQPVFNLKKVPWIQPNQASPDEISNVIESCPSGALHYERNDGGSAEAMPAVNIVLPSLNGPIYIHGNVKITSPDAETYQDTRVALCRCGASKNKPFCDNSHQLIGFEAPDRSSIPDGQAHALEFSGSLEITPEANGPFRLEANFEIHNDEGKSLYQGHKTTLCRCGESQNKPFCDDSHLLIGFETGSSP